MSRSYLKPGIAMITAPSQGYAGNAYAAQDRPSSRKPPKPSAAPSEAATSDTNSAAPASARPSDETITVGLAV